MSISTKERFGIGTLISMVLFTLWTIGFPIYCLYNIDLADQRDVFNDWVGGMFVGLILFIFFSYPYAILALYGGDKDEIPAIPMNRYDSKKIAS